MDNIQSNIEALYNEIIVVQKRYRLEQSVISLAASKSQPPSAIRSAFSAGIKHFGENYLQEGLDKQRKLTDLPITWHFIGRIQSRKIKQIAQNFSWAQSVCDLETAEKLNKHRHITQPPLNICLQVNPDADAQKAGILLADIEDIVKQFDFPHCRLRGLMVMTRNTNNLELRFQSYLKCAQVFQTLQQQNHALDTLSMGMSFDYRQAIQAGSTLIRIGTGIFGPRE